MYFLKIFKVILLLIFIASLPELIQHKEAYDYAVNYDPESIYLEVPLNEEFTYKALRDGRHNIIVKLPLYENATTYHAQKFGAALFYVEKSNEQIFRITSTVNNSSQEVEDIEDLTINYYQTTKENNYFKLDYMRMVEGEENTVFIESNSDVKVFISGNRVLEHSTNVKATKALFITNCIFTSTTLVLFLACPPYYPKFLKKKTSF